MKQDSRFGTPLITNFYSCFLGVIKNILKGNTKNQVWKYLHRINLVQNLLLLLSQAIPDFLTRTHDLNIGNT